MEEDRIDKEGKGDKIGDFTRDYADVIGRNQIRGSKMAVQKLALLGEQEYQPIISRQHPLKLEPLTQSAQPQGCLNQMHSLPTLHIPLALLCIF